MRNFADKTCRESKNTHFMFNKCFRKPGRLRDNVEATEDNMAHAQCILDT